MRSAIVRAGIGAVAAGGLIAVGALAPAAATSVRPAVANATTFTVTAKGLSYVTDAKGEALLPGNTFEISEADMVRGHRVGTDYVTCSGVTKAVAECNATWNFGKLGSIQVGGLNPLTGNAFVVAITGGTGKYAGVGGTVGISFPKGNGPGKQVFHVTGSRVTP